MHPAWASDAARFISDIISEIGERPPNYHSLDRIKNDVGYVPGNIRWATWKEQANNKSSNRIITFNGVSRNTTQWSEITGLSEPTIRLRMKRGWDVGRVLNLPKQKGVKIKISNDDVNQILDLYKNSNLSQLKLAKKFNVSQSTIARIINGKQWAHI